jgi:hypothetical protein
MNKIIFVFLCLCGGGRYLMGMMYSDMVINKTVVTLVNTPSDISLSTLNQEHREDASIFQHAPHVFSKENKFGETQLLFGEHVLAGPEENGWVNILAVEQKIHNNNKELVSISGFVRPAVLSKMEYSFEQILVVTARWAKIVRSNYWFSKKLIDVSLGTTLFGIQKIGNKWKVKTPLGVGFIACNDVYEVSRNITENEENLRKEVLAGAQLFLGGPYTWGGCCSWIGYHKHPDSELLDQLSSIDCSGLVYLAFKRKGLRVPRNAHDQFLETEHQSSGAALQPGDLIFIARETNGGSRVGHVIFYVGKNEHEEDILLEVRGAYEPFGCNFIRAQDCPYLNSKALSDMVFGEKVSCVIDGTTCERIIYFGTFFTSGKIIQMRNAFFDRGR